MFDCLIVGLSMDMYVMLVEIRNASLGPLLKILPIPVCFLNLLRVTCLALAALLSLLLSAFFGTHKYQFCAGHSQGC